MFLNLLETRSFNDGFGGLDMVSVKRCPFIVANRRGDEMPMLHCTSETSYKEKGVLSSYRACRAARHWNRAVVAGG